MADDQPADNSTSGGSSAPVAAVLRGIHGWVDGERYHLTGDNAVVIGRSRSCDISLRRIVAYLDQPAGDRDNDHDFNTVSRRHIRIELDGTNATIEDLSTNGSYVNGELLSAPMTVSLSESPCEVRLGTRETFRLSLAEESSSVTADKPQPDSDVRQPAG